MGFFKRLFTTRQFGKGDRVIALSEDKWYVATVIRVGKTKDGKARLRLFFDDGSKAMVREPDFKYVKFVSYKTKKTKRALNDERADELVHLARDEVHIVQTKITKRSLRALEKAKAEKLAKVSPIAPWVGNLTVEKVNKKVSSIEAKIKRINAAAEKAYSKASQSAEEARVSVVLSPADKLALSSLEDEGPLGKSKDQVKLLRTKLEAYRWWLLNSTKEIPKSLRERFNDMMARVRYDKEYRQSQRKLLKEYPSLVGKNVTWENQYDSVSTGVVLKHLAGRPGEGPRYLARGIDTKSIGRLWKLPHASILSVTVPPDHASIQAEILARHKVLRESLTPGRRVHWKSASLGRIAVGEVTEFRGSLVSVMLEDGSVWKVYMHVIHIGDPVTSIPTL